MIDALKLRVNAYRQECIKALLDGSPSDYAAFKYLQGQFHCVDKIVSMIKQLEEVEEAEDLAEEREEKNKEKGKAKNG